MSYSWRPFGVSAAPRCSISPKRAVWLPSLPCWSLKATFSCRALKLVWRSRIGWRRVGGPSTTAFGGMPLAGMPSWIASMSRVRGVRWLMCGPLKATTSAIRRCWSCNCWYCSAVTVASWCQRKVCSASCTNASASAAFRPPSRSHWSISSRARAVKIWRLARMLSASSRSFGLSISSRRSSEVNTRNGLTCSDCSCTARKAVECTGTPAELRS
ncbi:hypothetical protein D3C75_808590 [compost metagenome]